MPIDPNALTQDGSEQPTGNSALSSDGLPEQIGPYRILELLGQGGMGKVLLGESQTPKRQAAIKLMLADGFDAEALSRFRREMEVLARLEHPGIARLYEVGSVTLAGQIQPWYAMEYVPGLPLDEYVRQHKLDVASVFRLMLEVAQALQFAHQKGVIHRDIKPANILVDQAGQPKILDFGIARLNEPEAVRKQTRFGQIIGTLAYMSPEQLSSSANADVRADVYALGVVLYELLAGQLPLEISTTSLLDAIKSAAEGKRTPLGDVRPRLRGEVELIVDTASSRDIQKRYASVADFAADLRNFLESRPLNARRPSLGYVFGKFVRRNPLIVSAISVAVISLIAATIWSLIAAETARLAQAKAVQSALEAKARAAESGAAVAFLTAALADAAPSNTLGRDVKLIDVLAGASREQFPAEQANVEVQIRRTLLETYLALGLFPEAERELNRMSSLCKSLSELDNCSLLMSLNAHLLSLSGRDEQARELGKNGLAQVRARFGGASEAAIDAQINYAELIQKQGDSAASIVELQDALARAENLPQNARLAPRLILKLRMTLSDSLAEQGDLAQAETVLDAAIAQAKTQLHPDLPAMLLARNSQHTFLVDHTKFAEAAIEFGTLLKDAKRVLGDEHRITMTITGNLAASLVQTGDLEQAAALLKLRADVFQRRYASDWKSILNSAVTLSNLQSKQSNFAHGLSDIDVAIGKAQSQPGFPAELANALGWRSYFLWKLGRLPEAEMQTQSLVDRFVAEYGEGDVQLARYRLRLALIWQDQNQNARAKPLLESVLPALLKAYGPDNQIVKDAQNGLKKCD